MYVMRFFLVCMCVDFMVHLKYFTLYVFLVLIIPHSLHGLILAFVYRFAQINRFTKLWTKKSTKPNTQEIIQHFQIDDNFNENYTNFISSKLNEAIHTYY